MECERSGDGILIYLADLGIHEKRIISENVIKAFIDDSNLKRTWNFEIIGIVVLSTQLHEELH